MEFILKIVLPSAVVSTLVSGLIQVFIWRKNRDEERYIKLYGPLKFNLLMMKLITRNKEEIGIDIKRDVLNVEDRNDAHKNHITPLTKVWLWHRDEILKLLKEYPGYIKEEHYNLIEDFVDGHLKREIIQDGQNGLTTEERIDKVLNAVKKLQEKLL